MTKEELILLTLKQLSDNLNNSLESFELLEDPDWPIEEPNKRYITIVWRNVISIGEDSYLDPNNSPRSILLTYSMFAKKLSCHIYFRDVDSANKAVMADASIEISYRVPVLNKSYRKFSLLRKSLIKKLKEKDRLHYLKKLNTIFPAILDEKLLD